MSKQKPTDYEYAVISFLSYKSLTPGYAIPAQWEQDTCLEKDTTQAKLTLYH